MGLFSNFFGSGDSINYRRVDYVETHRNIGRFVALSQTPDKDGGKMYFKKDIAEALNDIAGNCNEKTLRQLIKVFPTVAGCVEYK